jgi:Spy/CpxP family protein refolding chaperone
VRGLCIVPFKKSINNMKRIFASTLALLLFAGVSQAQVKDTTHRQHPMMQHMKAKAEKHHHEMAKQLNLTADQKTKLKALHEQEKAEADALKNQKLTLDEHRAKREELHQKYQAQMKAILTPEQQQKMATMHQNMGKKGNDNALRRKGEDLKRDGESRDTLHARGHRDEMKNQGMRNAKDMADELNLTADQRAKAKDIRQNYKTRFEALKNDTTLSQDQKKAKLQELMKAQQEEMKTILTPEQVQKMETLRQQHGKKVKK